MTYIYTFFHRHFYIIATSYLWVVRPVYMKNVIHGSLTTGIAADGSYDSHGVAASTANMRMADFAFSIHN